MLEYFISPSGSDNNPGTREQPLRTYATAEKKSLTVAGSGSPRFYFDANGNHGPIYIKRNGLDNDPMIIDAYNGDYARFEFDSPTTAIYNKGRKNIVFQNLWIQMRQRKTGFYAHGCENITLRDSVIDSASYGVDFGTTTARSKNLTVERTVIRNCWDIHGQRSQGLYAIAVDGLKIINCVFSKNGWKEGQTNHVFVQQNHNLYLAETNTNVEVRDCFIGEASSHGVQLRSGGIISGCLFYFNPIHAFGQNDQAIFENNVVEGSKILGHGTAVITDVWRGWGYDAEAARNVVQNNLFINGGLDIPHCHALELGNIVRSTAPDAGSLISGNRIYNWKVAGYKNNSGRTAELVDNKFEYTPTTISSMPYLGDVDKRNWPNIPAIREQLMHDYRAINVPEAVKEKLATLKSTTQAQMHEVKKTTQDSLQNIEQSFQEGLQDITKFIEDNT